MSKLGNLCDRFIEAGWLVALALVPLYINFFSSRSWSVEKAYFLRVVVLLMAGAWLMKLWEGGADRGVRHAFAPLWKNPLAVPVVAYVLVLLISTAASVSPSLSFGGSFIRLQGAFTTLIYISLFCLIGLNLRTWEQFDRIISVLLLASIPITLYAVVQELGWDPIVLGSTWETLQWPVRSTLGNHIFLGGYLIMLMPWAAARLIDAVERRRQGVSNGASSTGSALLGGVCILVQNLALALFLVPSFNSQQLSWMTLPVLAGYLFLVVWTTRLEGKIPPLAMVIAYSTLLILQSIALAFTQARGPWLAGLAGAALFGLLIALRWRMRRLMAGVLLGTLLVGLFIVVLNVPRGPLQPLKRYALLKRLGSVSVSSERGSGSIIYRLLLWQTVGRLVWSWPNIGLSHDPLERVRPLIGYGPETLGLTIEKVLVPGLAPGDSWQNIQDRAHNDSLDQLAESGLLGLAAFLFLLITFYRVTLKALWQSQERAHQLSLITLITATTAHLVEIQFGIAVTASRTLFWLFLALGIFLTRPLDTIGAEEEQESHSPWKSWMIPYVLLTLLLLVAQITTVRIEEISIGLFVGFGWLLFAMALLTLDLGLPASEQTARWHNWWIHALTVGVVGLLIYHASFRPLVAGAFFASGRATDQRRALTSYQQAATIDPREDAYYAELGMHLTRLGLAVWTQMPDVKPPEGFQPSVALALTFDPRSIVRLGGEGVLGLAEASFQEARRLQPLDARRAFDLARLNHLWGLQGRQERLDTALRYYQESAELSPNRLIILLNWAMVDLDKNQPMQALQRMQSAQSIGHRSWLIHYTRALAHNKLGNRDLVLKEAQTAISLGSMPKRRPRERSDWEHIQKNLVPKLEEELNLPPGSLSKEG